MGGTRHRAAGLLPHSTLVSRPRTFDRELDAGSRRTWRRGSTRAGGFAALLVWTLASVNMALDPDRHSFTSACLDAAIVLMGSALWLLLARPNLRSDRERVQINGPLRTFDIPWTAVREIRSGGQYLEFFTVDGSFTTTAVECSPLRAAFDRSPVEATAREMTGIWQAARNGDPDRPIEMHWRTPSGLADWLGGTATAGLLLHPVLMIVT